MNFKIKTFLGIIGFTILLNIVLYALIKNYVPDHGNMNKIIILNIILLWVGGIIRIIVEKRIEKNDKS